MKKNRSGFAFILSLVLLSALWESWGPRLQQIFRSPQRLGLMWRFDRISVIVTVAFLILAVTAVLSFLGMFRGKKAVRRAPVKKAPEEEPLTCEHVRGREKYLEQIDGYLRTGLIDRDEYKVLKERYMRIDIPEDYH
ncbi:MAG: hypothetical protein IJV40_05080 [Oscillospiraceae bacterium]|nr:hypothetical protein [Oscillospiraceae bacterium]